MLLAIDIGNTNITVGIFRGEILLGNFRMTTQMPRTSDEYGVLMRELIQTIIADYMRNSDTKDVRDLSFISYSVTVKPNAKDPSIIRIKELIYMFLEDNSAGYRRRKNRIATQNSYYKAILEYVVLIINKANK